jgi:hypothetical protein
MIGNDLREARGGLFKADKAPAFAGSRIYTDVRGIENGV